MITAQKSGELVAKFGNNGKDTGRPEVQVAILSERIKNLTGHFATHKKDYTSMRGMMKLIGKRRALLNYLQSEDQARYEKIVSELQLRK